MEGDWCKNLSILLLLQHGWNQILFSLNVLLELKNMVLLYKRLHLVKYTGFFEDDQCRDDYFPNQILWQACLIRLIFKSKNLYYICDQYPKKDASSSTAPSAWNMLSSLARLSPVNVDVIPLSPVFVYILRNLLDWRSVSLDEVLLNVNKVMIKIRVSVKHLIICFAVLIP